MRNESIDVRLPVRYVIITPAANEAWSIERTIASVVSQTVKPSRWVIVDDGSTDGTAELVSQYAPSYSFMRLVRIQSTGERNFAKKVAAFNFGLRALDDIQYSFIGNLDADVSFAPDYYGRILAEFEKDPRLGIAGGIVYTRTGEGFTTDDTARNSVGGAVQLFRSKCFEQIGGYLPLRNGGIDAAAEIMARMKGWTVRKFPDNKVWEHRRTGSAGNSVLMSMYKLGVRFHTLGYGTGFFILRSVYKAKSSPFLLGSLAMLLGFLLARIRKYPLNLAPEIVSYLRTEQAKILREKLSGIVSRPG